MVARWNDQDDAKLFTLFKNNKLDPTKQDKDSVKDAHQRYFPDRPNYNSFALLYRRRCNAYCTENQLAGARKRGNQHCSLFLLLLFI